MSSITGSFSGKITKYFAIPLKDLPNHDMNIAEVSGTQKSDDPLWNNAAITYWGVTDVFDGEGTQRGYYNNVHPDGGRDFGTFEGKVTSTSGGMIVEGTFKIDGGDGQYRGITGNGAFKTVSRSETDVEATWQGSYELARAQSG